MPPTQRQSSIVPRPSPPPGEPRSDPEPTRPEPGTPRTATEPAGTAPEPAGTAPGPASAAPDAVPGAAADDLRYVVPPALRVAAALAWRLLVVVAALYVVGRVVAYLAAVVIPVAVALLLAVLLAPAVAWLQRRSIGGGRPVPRGLATALMLIGGLAALGGVLTFVVSTFVSGVPALGAQLTTSVDSITTWLATGPLKLSETQLAGVRQQALDSLSANQASITAGALTTAATIGELLTETLLVIFTLIFFLYGGADIWRFVLKAAPRAVRTRVDVAGRRGIAALVGYVRATAAVAVMDGLAIGIGLAILRVPLAVPLAALVFLGAFIPIIGAVVAGGVAVLVALVSHGPVTALIVLAIIVAIMQLESHVLQPLLLGRAVKLHPLAVVLTIATGLLVGGIAGALLAVPLLAVLNSGIRSLISEADRYADPAGVHASEPEDSGPADAGLEREPDLDLGGHHPDHHPDHHRADRH